MPTLCMDGFVWVDICDLRRAENRMKINLISSLKTITYKQISISRKRVDVIPKTGRQRGNKDYESAALTIELRAQTYYLLYLTAFTRFLLTLIVTIFCKHRAPCHRFPKRKRRNAATFKKHPLGSGGQQPEVYRRRWLAALRCHGSPRLRLRWIGQYVPSPSGCPRSSACKKSQTISNVNPRKQGENKDTQPRENVDVFDLDASASLTMSGLRDGSGRSTPGTSAHR